MVPNKAESAYLHILEKVLACTTTASGHLNTDNENLEELMLTSIASKALELKMLC